MQAYLNGEGGYRYLAEKYKIGKNDKNQVKKWVNGYRIAGLDALREKNKGRKPIMPKVKKEENPNENTKYLKQLEDENLKLKIENAYLKELRRLRLEEEALNTKRELSVVSEDNLD